MTELDIEFVFGCAILAACVSLMLYLILDYARMCRASRFGSIEEALEDARRVIHSATGITDLPINNGRRLSNPNATPLYGERR